MTMINVRRDLAERIESIARHENREVDDLIAEMLEHYDNLTLTSPRDADQNTRLASMRHRVYERARSYWIAHDDPRAMMTDEMLDARFAFVDAEGVPHLKEEEGVEQVFSPLLEMARMAERQNLGSIEGDIAERSRELLGQIISERHRKRLNDQ